MLPAISKHDVQTGAVNRDWKERVRWFLARRLWPSRSIHAAFSMTQVRDASRQPCQY